jgi:undecaprenyl pyrophosphate synthase
MAGHPRRDGKPAPCDHATEDFCIKYLTIYAISTENRSCPEDEVQGLLHIVADVIDAN